MRGLRLLIRFEEDGRFTAEVVTANAHVLCLEDYEFLLEKSGYAIVPKEHAIAIRILAEASVKLLAD